MQPIIILMGAPGSGKGTQAKLIAKAYNYGHISTGELLRGLEQEKPNDPKIEGVFADMKKGVLVPDWLIYDLAFKEMDKYLAKGQGVVLDGAIRNLEQAKAYQEYFLTKGLQLTDILVLEVSITEGESIDRLTKRRTCSDCGEIIPWSSDTKSITTCPRCGGELLTRQDDNIVTIKARIEEQGNEVLKPLVGYYQQLGVFAAVDGMQSIEEVWRQVDVMLKK
ncbi:MAG: nucleoside monophosphate kinase [bacterium]|nr:nucleoside monophosphate kinase [bacterium]